MKLENIFFSVFLFVAVFALGTQFYADGLTQYGVSGDNTSFGKMSNNLAQIYDESVDDMKDKIQGEQVTSDDAVDNMIKGAYTASRIQPFFMGEVILNTTSTIITESKIIDPNPIFWAAGLLLTTSIIFAIIYLVMRLR